MALLETLALAIYFVLAFRSVYTGLCSLFLRRISIIEFLVILLYTSINVAFLAVAAAGHLPISAELLLPKLSITNLAVLFFGGRSNPIADLLGVPLQTYYMAHVLVGHTAPAQSTAHAFMAWAGANIHERISGTVLCVLAITTSFLSLQPFRELSRKYFAKIHSILSVLVYGAMVTHVLLTASTFTSFGWIVVFTSALTWLISQLTRLFRWCRHGICRVLRVTPTPDNEIVIVHVQASHPIAAQPGRYFYIYPAGLPFRFRLESRLAPVAYWSDETTESVRKFTFFLDRKWAAGFHQGGNVMLDGPYGKNLDARRYTTVILAANGIGISGILSFVMSIISSRQRNSSPGSKNRTLVDNVRKLDLLWMLDNETQVSWIYPFCSQLEKIQDTKKKVETWVFGCNKGYIPKAFHPHYLTTELFDRQACEIIHQEELRKASRTIIIVCGPPAFAMRVEREARKTSPAIQIEQLEYRPGTDYNGSLEKLMKVS